MADSLPQIKARSGSTILMNEVNNKMTLLASDDVDDTLRTLIDEDTNDL